jgi:tryptophan halogenase
MVQKIYFDDDTFIWKTKLNLHNSKDEILSNAQFIIDKVNQKYNNTESNIDCFGFEVQRTSEKGLGSIHVANKLLEAVQGGINECISLYGETAKPYNKVDIGLWVNVVRAKDPVQPEYKQKKLTGENGYHIHTEIAKANNDFEPAYTYVYYIQMPDVMDGDDGVLYFKGKNGKEYYVKPEEDDLIIMPGDMPHYPNYAPNSTKDRVVVAGNVGFDDVKKNIVIVGGGTAGWLTALYINNMYRDDANITLIESDEIGILGAGEGTVPLFIHTLKELGIDVYDFLIECNATHKIGISFENWNNDGKRYMHDFQRASMFDISKETNISQIDDKELYAEYNGYLIDNGIHPYEYSVSKKMAYANKSPILKDGDEPAGYSFHFDASLTAKYFRKVAESRGVVRIEGKTKDFNLDMKRNISAVVMEDGTKYESDFVFDCTGFKKLIIGQLFGTSWKSYEDKLTVNTAIPFFLPQSETEIKPYTRAIAMKYGWMWQIPLQNRWGCGYIFDDEFIDYNGAKKEVEEFLGRPIEVNRVIQFRAGRFDNNWVNNVIAIGLSAGFTEPLEATSIMIAIAGLRELSKDVLDNYNLNTIKEYNDFMSSYNDDIVDFLQFHYITKRTDTPFWEYYTKYAPLSENLASVVEEYIRNGDFQIEEKSRKAFGKTNYLEVGYGLGFFNDDYFKNKYKIFNSNEHIEEVHQQNAEAVGNALANSFTEKEFLDLVKIAYDKTKL